MELILVVVISAGMAGNSQNGVSRSLTLKRVPVDSERFNNIKINLKTYQSILRKLIRDSKKQYYQNKLRTVKMVRMVHHGAWCTTWYAINQILNRTQSNANLPGEFCIDNSMTSDQTLIANKFNDFFSNVWSKLTKNLGNGGVENFRNYLSNPRLINFTFELVSEDDIKELINNLPSKPSCGHDGISNKLLKACNQEICKPLTLIVNQMLSTGIFPDYLKTAKVIPLFKNGKQELLDKLSSNSLTTVTL